MMIAPSGHKSYFWFRKVGGRPEWKSLGSLTDVSVESARAEASKLNVAFAQWKAGGFQGPSPLERKSEPTFQLALDDYLAKHLADRPNATKTANWLTEKYISHLKARKLSGIQKKELRNLHQELGEKNGHHTANRVLQFIKAVVNWSLKQEMWAGPNPCTGICLYPEQSRKRFLKLDEMHQFIKALDDQGNVDLRDFAKLALFTGARRSNILSLEWEHIDWNRGMLNFPTSKNGQGYQVPLVSNALDILKQRRAKARSNRWVFPGYGKTGHLVEPKTAWGAFRKKAGLGDLRIHDLRRSLASTLAAMGVSVPIIAGVLGHRGFDSVQVYARTDAEAGRQPIKDAVVTLLKASRRKPRRAMPALPEQILYGGPQSASLPTQT